MAKYVKTEEGYKHIDDLFSDNGIDILIENDLLPATTDTSGAILTDENGKIILRY